MITETDHEVAMLECVCGHSAPAVLTDTEGFYKFSCGNCDTERYVAQSKMNLDDFYNSDNSYKEEIDLSEKVDDLLRWLHRKIYSYIVSNFKPGTRTYEFGCFDGFFVKKLSEAGMASSGSDFNKAAIASGREKFGLHDKIEVGNAVKSTIDDSNRVDIVLALDVIEHLENPVDLVRAGRDRLRDGGYFICSVPNNRMFYRLKCDYPPHHLTRFSPKGIRAMFEGQSFEVLDIFEQTDIFDMFRNIAGDALGKSRNGTSKTAAGKHVLTVKKILNSVSGPIRLLVSPVGHFLGLFGFRYNTMVVVAKHKPL